MAFATERHSSTSHLFVSDAEKNRTSEAQQHFRLHGRSVLALKTFRIVTR